MKRTSSSSDVLGAQNSKGFQSKLKLTFRPPKFLLEASGMGLSRGLNVSFDEQLGGEADGGDLPGRVRHFVERQREFALWENEQREKEVRALDPFLTFASELTPSCWQWQALTEDLDSRLDKIRVKLAPPQSPRQDTAGAGALVSLKSLVSLRFGLFSLCREHAVLVA
eukprot:3932513-Rhodomonas_salina.1